MSAVVPSGCASGETEPSGFITIEPERVPPTSATLTVKLAAGFDDFAKTGRAAPERAAIVTSRVVWDEVCRNEACPPGGCVTVRRKVRWLARQVLERHDEGSLERRGERLDVLGRAHDEPLGDPAAVDVLVAHAFLADDAGRSLLRGIGHALVHRARRRVVRPVAVQGRLDVAVVGPAGVGDERARRRRVERPCRRLRWP